MSIVNVKNQAKVVQSRMKELGYEDFKLGHAQELIASLYGEKSWNTLSSKSVSLQDVFKNTVTPQEISAVGKKEFEVKLKTEVEARCFLTVKADNAAEAYTKVEEYLDSSLGQKTLYDISSWEVSHIDSFSNPRITEFSGSPFQCHNEDGVTPEDFLRSVVDGEIVPEVLDYVKSKEEISHSELQEYLINKYSLSEDEAGELPFRMVHDLSLLRARELPDGSDFIFCVGKMSTLEKHALG